jgi:hypothetical protein
MEKAASMPHMPKATMQRALFIFLPSLYQYNKPGDETPKSSIDSDENGQEKKRGREISFSMALCDLGKLTY